MSLPSLRGRAAWIFTESDFDVDQIVGVKNIKITEIEELAQLAMKSYDPDFAKAVKPGDLLVGGVNFGYGHPHYPPLRAMRHLGIKALLAESFSPGFWRGEISMGFPLLAVPGITKETGRWDELGVDWNESTVLNYRTGRKLAFEPLSSADRQMIEFGGLLGYLKSRSATTA
ncbi:MAG TPA: 3-isopropylmalate dehydratase [Ramlibacter sp.]|jgi:3-isopropylmalate/(R)-2-methylmalate dehydratase small subunit|nr:3-isopropylmalate dehydratase [Ramlibacter sp.]